MDQDGGIDSKENNSSKKASFPVFGLIHQAGHPHRGESGLQLQGSVLSIAAMEPSQTQNMSLQRLQNVEKSIVRDLELAGGAMDELANPVGPRKDMLNKHCGEFMKLIKEIQGTLREEIKSACEYRPFEKCDYSARLSSEICCKKLEHVLSCLDKMKQTIDGYNSLS